MVFQQEENNTGVRGCSPRMGSTLYIDDVAYWERKYPGYTLNRVETRVSNAGWRHTTVIMRRVECWHGTPGRKVTPRMNR